MKILVNSNWHFLFELLFKDKISHDQKSATLPLYEHIALDFWMIEIA